MLSKFPRYPLTFGPTHIEKLSRLTAHLGGDVELYAKREDCNSGLAFGGNKLRKLEYIIPDAIASNADTLVSIGGVQSNHTRMVAAVAAKIGMKCRLVQNSSRPCENSVGVIESSTDRGFGAFLGFWPEIAPVASWKAWGAPPPVSPRNYAIWPLSSGDGRHHLVHAEMLSTRRKL